ncbi:MAG: Mov34/MPN/PAD-1 family protein [Candidatus Rokuibacteriota bacterium]
MIVTASELAAIRRQAEAEYPAECCGVVLTRPGDRVLYPCRNVQNDRHAEDPEKFPRTARDAYYMHPEDLRALSGREEQGYGVHVIYHSHVDVGAYFSPTDRRNALLDGEPLYPETIYVVVAVDAGRAGEARAFRWDPRAREFVEVSMSHD